MFDPAVARRRRLKPSVGRTKTTENGRAKSLLRFVVGQTNTTFFGPLVAQTDPQGNPSHGALCRTSCPDCLRDFSNLAYHNILDWRLGLDLARLALDPNAPIDFSVSYWQGLDAAAAGPYFAAMPGWQQVTFGGLQAGRRGNLVEIITHPLWNTVPNHASPSAQHCQWCPYKLFCAPFWQTASPEWSGHLDGAAVEGVIAESPSAIHAGAAIAVAPDIQTGSEARRRAQIAPLNPVAHPVVITQAAGERIRIVGLRARRDGVLVPGERTVMCRVDDVPIVTTDRQPQEAQHDA